MKTNTIITLIMMIGIACAITDYKSGDNIIIRTVFNEAGTPTAGADCNLDLYDGTTDNIILQTDMTDNSDGWYYYTINGWLTTENISYFSGLVNCSKDGYSDTQTFQFNVVSQLSDKWFTDLNDTLNNIMGTVNANITLDMNISIMQDQLVDINSTTHNISEQLVNMNDGIDDINTILYDTFATTTTTLYPCGQTYLSLHNDSMNYQLCLNNPQNCFYQNQTIPYNTCNATILYLKRKPIEFITPTNAFNLAALFLSISIPIFLIFLLTSFILIMLNFFRR